jgi:hypothetical protein
MNKIDLRMRTPNVSQALRGEGRNALSYGTAALPPNIRACGGPSTIGSEPDWHFREKSIHP